MLAAMRAKYLMFAAAIALGSAACDGTDDADGARGSCASGGALGGCADSPTTAEGACWRLVECGVMPVDAAEDGDIDWGQCVNRLEAMIAERGQLVMACVASSTCDELLAPGSPQPWDWPLCFQYGDQ